MHTPVFLATLALCWACALGSARSAEPVQPVPPEGQALRALFDRHFEGVMRRYPGWATYRGDHRYNDRLEDRSPPALADADAAAVRWLAEARALPRDRLSASDRTSLDIFIGAREREIAMQPFTGYRGLRVAALGGAQSDFADLMLVVPTATRLQVEQLMQRMAALPTLMGQDIDSMRRSQALGWVPAASVLDRVIGQLDAQLALPLSDSPYYGPFKRLGEGIPAAERTELQAAGRAAVERDVLPAMRRLRAYVAEEARPKAPANGSLSHYPGGAAVYDVIVRQMTTTALSAAQIHAIGQRELARLRGEMEAVMRELKYAGDFGSFVRHLYTDPKFFYDSPEALLAGYRDIAKRIDAELPRLFAELPRAPYGVRAMPAFRGPDAAEYYDSPSRDGSRGGWFNANAAGVAKKPRWSMATLTAHEGAPGHHVQSARALELKDLPEFRRNGWYPAYGEGWALYAETLGLEIGLYDDPYARFGHLQAQAHRAARLVVDTGIHSLGWSRQQAVDLMAERTGLHRDFVGAEVDRYISWPGQALTYMVGQLKIRELRERAQLALGPKFDLRRFHNAVLDQGALPLDTLERVIDGWVAAERSR
jgi:uncharacterized protein (DUF885 family)